MALTANCSLFFPRNGHNGEDYFDYFSISAAEDFDEPYQEDQTRHRYSLMKREKPPLGRDTPNKRTK